MSAPGSVKRSKLHLALTLAIVGLGMVGGPYGLASAGLISQLKPHAWVVLAVAYVGVLLKSSIGYLTTRHFRYDKAAYDLSVLVFGGVLTCAALQVVTTTDLFPGLENMHFLSFVAAFGLDIRGQHLVLLSMLLIFSLVGTVLSAIDVAETEDGRPGGCWTVVCSFIAYVLLAAYALALIAKG